MMGGASYREILANFAKNFLAYAIPVAILQLYLFPNVANTLGEELNGRFLTILALNYFLTNITAGVLSQTRLLRNKEYQDAGISGDFNLLLLPMAFCNATITTVGLFLIMGSEATGTEIGLSIMVSLLFLLHDYITIQYRINLRFSKILISNLILSAGYFVGLYCFHHVLCKWQVIFICAYEINEIYDIASTTLLKERICRTRLFKPTLNKYATLLGASLISHLMIYGDRLLLYPCTSGSDVSVLNSAEMVGKMLMLLSTPLSSFLLSYLVRIEKISFQFSFGKAVVLLLICVGVYGSCVAISYPVVGYLYPMWADRSLKLVPLTAMVSLVNLISVLFNVLLLRYCHAKWQIVINVSYFGAYMLFSFSLLYFYGLTGFCIGNLMAVMVKLGIIIWIFKHNYLGRINP